MEMQSNLVDLNTAERVELRNVPGIGSKLADRIIAGRPFSDLTDLRRVSGVGPALFDQIKFYVAVSSSPEPVLLSKALSSEPEQTTNLQQPSEGSPSLALENEQAPVSTVLPLMDGLVMQAGEAGLSNPVPPPDIPDSSAPEPVLPEQPFLPPPAPPASPDAAVPEQPANRGITRAEMYGIATASGVLSFILAVLFTLLFLGLINGGWRFARLADMNQLASQVNTIDAQANELSGEIDGLKTRLTTVEGLDGRVTSVEQDARQLRKDVDTLSGSADALTKRIDDLSFQVDALIARTGRFQGFLDGMRNLLNNLNQLEVP